MQGISQLTETAKMLQNPQQAVMQVFQPSDDQMQQAQEYIRQNGGNAQHACIHWANQTGYDMNAVQQAYQMARQMFGSKR